MKLRKVLAVVLGFGLVVALFLITVSSSEASWFDKPMIDWFFDDALEARQAEFDKFVSSPTSVATTSFTFSIPAGQTLVLFAGHANCSGHEEMLYEDGQLHIFTLNNAGGNVLSVSCSNLAAGAAQYAFYAVGEVPNSEALAAQPLLDSQNHCGYACIKVHTHIDGQWNLYLRNDMKYAPLPTNPPPGFTPNAPQIPTATPTPTETSTPVATEVPVVYALYLPQTMRGQVNNNPQQPTSTAVPPEEYGEGHCGGDSDGVISNYNTASPVVSIPTGYYGTWATMDSGTILASSSVQTFTVPANARALILATSNYSLEGLSMSNGHANLSACGTLAPMPSSRQEELIGSWEGEVWVVQVSDYGVITAYQH